MIGRVLAERCCMEGTTMVSATLARLRTQSEARAKRNVDWQELYGSNRFVWKMPYRMISCTVTSRTEPHDYQTEAVAQQSVYCGGGIRAAWTNPCSRRRRVSGEPSARRFVHADQGRREDRERLLRRRFV